MTRDDAEMAAINALGYEFSDDARRIVSVLQSLGLIKLIDNPNDKELWLIQKILDEAASRLEGFNTNPLYHKALIRGAKIIRDMKHEWEMRAVSSFRQGGEAALRRYSERASEQN